MSYAECALCNVNSLAVRPRLVEWAEPIGGKRFELVPTCRDVVDCLARVRAQGESWPLAMTTSERIEQEAFR